MKINPLLLSKLYALLKRLGIFVALKQLFKIFTTQQQPSMALSERITELILANVEFANQQVEDIVESYALSCLELNDATRTVEALGLEGADAQVAEGLVTLATLQGTLFASLSPEAQQQVTDTVALIVTGPNEAQVEALYNACVRNIATAKSMSELVDANTVTPEGE